MPARVRWASYTGSEASRSARAAPSSLVAVPPAMPCCQVSRIVAPSRLSWYCTRWPSQAHQARSTGGPIQSGSAMAWSRVIALAGALAAAGVCACACGASSRRVMARAEAIGVGRMDKWTGPVVSGREWVKPSQPSSLRVCRIGPCVMAKRWRGACCGVAAPSTRPGWPRCGRSSERTAAFAVQGVGRRWIPVFAGMAIPEAGPPGYFCGRAVRRVDTAVSDRSEPMRPGCGGAQYPARRHCACRGGTLSGCPAAVANPVRLRDLVPHPVPGLHDRPGELAGLRRMALAAHPRHAVARPVSSSGPRSSPCRSAWAWCPASS